MPTPRRSRENTAAAPSGPRFRRPNRYPAAMSSTIAPNNSAAQRHGPPPGPLNDEVSIDCETPPADMLIDTHGNTAPIRPTSPATRSPTGTSRRALDGGAGWAGRSWGSVIAHSVLSGNDNGTTFGDPTADPNCLSHIGPDHCVYGRSSHSEHGRALDAGTVSDPGLRASPK